MIRIAALLLATLPVLAIAGCSRKPKQHKDILTVMYSMPGVKDAQVFTCDLEYYDACFIALPNASLAIHNEDKEMAPHDTAR